VVLQLCTSTIKTSNGTSCSKRYPIGKTLIQNHSQININLHRPHHRLRRRTSKTMSGGRFRELLKKYGKVAIGVHCSVSAASVAGIYVAIRNNVDVEAILEKFHLGASSPEENPNLNSDTDSSAVPVKNRTAQMAASAGGAFTLAVLCNKALIPVRVPITIALTPPIARFLARRKIVKTGV